MGHLGDYLHGGGLLSYAKHKRLLIGHNPVNSLFELDVITEQSPTRTAGVFLWLDQPVAKSVADQAGLFMDVELPHESHPVRFGSLYANSQ